MSRTYVELFAGCGGLSLGLSSLGYERLLANELSPMAAETYAYNLLGSDLASPAFKDQALNTRKVLWLRSAYASGEMSRRLAENPFEVPDDGYSDLRPNVDLTGKLIVADIRALNRYIADNEGKPLVNAPDVISGGPPCQSFSLAGTREYGNHRNRLPWEFASFVFTHQPKLAILENVSGILLPFKEGDKKVFAWFEVAKAFAKIGYAPICLHVNAVDVGVAQNRPRFLMFAVRGDIVDDVRERLGADKWIMDMGEALLEAEGEMSYDLSRHKVIDVRGRRVNDVFLTPEARGIFGGVDPVPVSSAINDLSHGTRRSHYAEGLSEIFAASLNHPSLTGTDEPANNQPRVHTPRVQARFRVYQVLGRMGARSEDAVQILNHLRSKAGLPEVLPGRLAQALLDYADEPLVGLDGHPVLEVKYVQWLFDQIRTQKHSQKALCPDLPAPAALSIPDDACHYTELRTLSVREMARIQSFPDEFVFRSIPTTGGARRKFQVPQYTQVGNAVPPKLGRAIGQFADYLLGYRQTR